MSFLTNRTEPSLIKDSALFLSCFGLKLSQIRLGLLRDNHVIIYIWNY